MRQRAVVWMAAVLAGLALAPASFAGDLNLWISYHFTGMESYRAGKYLDAESLLKLAKPETCDDNREAFTLNGLGKVESALGNYPEADKYFQKALALREKSCGKESHFVPAILNNMGDLQYIAGDKCKAKCLYRKALDLEEKDQLSIEVSRSLNGLALLANDEGNYVEAENLLKRAIAVHDKGGRREHPYCATALVNLASLYTNLGRTCEAKPLFKRAEYIQKQTIGCDHPDVAVRLHAYAGYLTKIGNLDEARCAQERANEIQVRFAELNKKA